MRKTYFEHGAARLVELCRGCGLLAANEEVTGLFAAMTAPWGDRAIEPGSGPWRPDVADDHTPYEFSVAFGAADPELRLLVEAQADEDTPSPAANWRAALALSRRLGERFGAALDRHDRVAELFRPGDGARLAIWHAASIAPGRPPVFKVYFDAQAQGRARAAALVEEALCRLGFSRAWPAVRRMGARGPARDELMYVSLDLTPGEESRVKVYWRHHDVTAAELAALVAPLEIEDARAVEFCRAMTGHDGPYRARPPFTCTSLVDPASDRARSATLYVPVAAYAETDAVAVARVAGWLEREGLDAARYRTIVEGYAQRRLDATAGLHSYVALRRRGGRTQVTTYLSPEAHGVRAAGAAIPRPGPTPVLRDATAIVDRYEHEIVLADHPFLRRLGREPVNLGHLWLILANFWEAIVHDFPARLSRVIARLDDDHLRCIFVKQLDDELGHGDFARAHKPMFQRLVAALAAYRPAGDDDVLLAPGRALGRRLEALLLQGEVDEAIGALMIIEIYGKQNDIRLADEFRRQSALAREDLEWLHLHEDLEVDHADDSLAVARLLPRAGECAAGDRRLAAAWRGAEGVVDASIAFFDDLYRVCFP